MKKYMISTLAMAMTLAMTTATFAATPTNTSVSYDPETITVTITDDETGEVVEYVSARDYAESLSYTVVWDNETDTITFTKGENTFIAKVGSNEYYADVKGSDPKVVELEDEVILVEGTTYVPSSFAKMLRDVPVVDPVAPGRDLSQYETITPTVPVVDTVTPEVEVPDRDLGQYETITPTLPVVDTVTPEVEVPDRDLGQYQTITPAVPVVGDIFNDIAVTPLMDVETAKMIGEKIDNELSALTEEYLSAVEEDKAEFVENGGDIADYVEPTYEIGYDIFSRNENYVRVRFYVDSSLDDLDKEYALTYDTNTGEIITLER